MKIASNPRRSRRRKSVRSNSRRRSRRSRRNPGLSIGSPVSALTAGFKPAVLSNAVITGAGALGNSFLSGAVSSYAPSFLRSGWGNYALGLATAGVLKALTNMVAPRYSSDVFNGAVLEVVLRIANEQLMPKAAAVAVATTKGLNDYLTEQQVANARPLGELNDYLTEQQVASARPLGYMSCGDEAVAEVLASDGLAGSLY